MREIETLACVSEIRSARRAFVESHHDVRANGPFYVHHTFWGEEMFGAVNMTTKLATILTQFADTRERKNLKATTIGEHWFVKTIELVQTSRSFQHIKSWTEIEMIRVSEDDWAFTSSRIS